MSQASKHVDWCLKKAEKELAEKGFHRGLIKKEPDKELAGKHIAKADHNLQAAIQFSKIGYSDWSPSAFFYSLYHCFQAIIVNSGYETRNQECTIALIESLKEEGKIEIDDKFISTLKVQIEDEHDKSLIEIREDFQYGTQLEYPQSVEFRRFHELCQELIDKTKNIVFTNN